MRAQKKHAAGSAGRRLVAAVCLLAVLCLPAGLITAATPVRQLYSGFAFETNAVAGSVVDMDSRSVLYNLNRQEPIPCTLASRLMLLLLVAETFDSQQVVSITSEAAAVEKAKPTADQVTLQTGQRVSVEFLALRSLYYHSPGAIAALAGMFNRDVNQLVALMKSRAANLDLKQTTFEKMAEPGRSEYLFLPYSPFTSAGDLMRIAMAVMNNQRGRGYLARGDAYLQIDAGSRRIVALRSPLTELRVQSEDKVSAAYRGSDEQYSVDLVFGETADGIEAGCLLAAPREPAEPDAILGLFDAVEAHYTRSRLTTRGEPVPSLSETAENGETFGLLYLDDVYYTHPKGDPFLKETVSYEGDPPYNPPLQPDTPTGRVVFELANGYKIAASVGPDRAILSESSVYSRFLLALQNNPNLTSILLGATILLFVLLLFGVIRNVFRATYFYRLGGPGKRK